MPRPKTIDLTPNSAAEDARINDGIAVDPDNGEWVAASFAKAAPAEAAMPPAIYDALLRRRGPQKAPVKVSISLRVDRDVLDGWRASGPGWQARMNDALRKTIPR
jgi:uncharacterized protein (DUF4415 family)